MAQYTLRFDTGAELTLRETHGAKGQTYLAARPASEQIVSRFGFTVPIKVVGGKLPSKATVLRDGQKVGEIALSKGVTTTSGNPMVKGTNGVEVEVAGEKQTLKVERISQPHDSTANVLIRSSRPSGGGRSFDSL